jgi:phosphoserine phosphatase RsbU/P
MGFLPVVAYERKECSLAGPARLFLFSDGAYEIMRPDGTLLEFEAFEEVLTRAVPEGASEREELLHFAQNFNGSRNLDDDFSNNKDDNLTGRPGGVFVAASESV